MLEDYESPHNLSVSVFGRIAGKSRDQINREIRARKLLTLSLGNRGLRVPDWHLDPLRNELVYTLLQQADGLDMWELYRALSRPRDELGGRSAIEAVTRDNFPGMAMHVQSALRVRQRSSLQAV